MKNIQDIQDIEMKGLSDDAMILLTEVLEKFYTNIENLTKSDNEQIKLISSLKEIIEGLQITIKGMLEGMEGRDDFSQKQLIFIGDLEKRIITLEAKLKESE